MATSSTQPPQNNAGSRWYGSFVLSLYDNWVLRFNNSYVWLCPTQRILVPFFQEHFTKNHLDIGVGTGFFPATILDRQRSQGIPVDDQRLTLMDLNTNALRAAQGRVLQRHAGVKAVDCVRGNATDTSQASIKGGPFSSISMSLLLHCIPGSAGSKARAFTLAKDNLTDDGVLAGATILGKAWKKDQEKDSYVVPSSTKPRWLASLVLRYFNWTKVFDNWGDDPNIFEAALKKEFKEVETRIEGMMFLFTAKSPRRD